MVDQALRADLYIFYKNKLLPLGHLAGIIYKGKFTGYNKLSGLGIKFRND